MSFVSSKRLTQVSLIFLTLVSMVVTFKVEATPILNNTAKQNKFNLTVLQGLKTTQR